MKTINCAHCGVAFEQYRTVHRYCSGKCRSIARKGPVLACQLCKREFRTRGKPPPGKGKFCSRKCYEDKGHLQRGFPEPEPVDGARWIELGEGAFTLVDADTFANVGHLKWFLAAGGLYAARTQRCGKKTSLVYLHRVVAGATEGVEVDHVNENKLDNRTGNLRHCGRPGNSTNKAIVRSRSGYRGVIQSSHHPTRFSARLTSAGKVHLLGTFNSDVGAALARDAAARRIHGAFAILNFPNEGERGIVRVDHPETCAA